MLRRHRLTISALIAGITMALAPSAASAGWGPVLQPAASANPSETALSVDGRGDVGAMWLQGYGRTVTLRATVKIAGRPAAVRTLRRARDRAIVGLASVLDRRGEFTVAWVERASTRGLLHGPITVRAAFRTPSGRWSAVQTISRTSAFASAQPQLAAAPDGTVALVFNAGIRSAPGMGVAWRRAGRPFGRVGSVPTGRSYVQEPTLVFDLTGRAFLSGIAGCDDEQRSAGVLLTATVRSRRFGPERTVAPAPATHLRFVLTGDGRALAAWIGAGCSTTEDLSGPVRAATLVDDAVGEPINVSALPSRELRLSGGPAGGGELSFTRFDSASPDGEAVVARVAPDGTITPPGRPADGWAAVTGDRAGDQLVVPARAAGFGPPTALGARPAAASTVEPSPLQGPSFFVTAGAPDGRALAAARPVGRALGIAVWRPSTSGPR